MTLEELIATLTTAQEMTDSQEEWTHGDFEIHAGMWLRAKFQFRGEAEASTIQHNTAAMVLEELERHRDLQGASGFWGRAAAKATNERDEWKLRAEKSESLIEQAQYRASAYKDEVESLKSTLEVEPDEWRTRAEQAEADRDDWKESASYWRTLAKAQIQQLENNK